MKLPVQKAKATVAATKPGGLMPKYPAKHTAPVAAMRAAISSPFQNFRHHHFF